MAPRVGTLSGWGSGALLLAGVFVFAVVAWLPALWNGLVQDDYVGVLLAGDRWHAWNVRDYFVPYDSAARYLRPLPPLTFYLDDALWGATRVWAWHLPGVLLHGLNSALVAALLLPRSRFAALAAGLTFGLHPLHTEPVGWISARPDLLMTTGLLASAVLFRRDLPAASAVAFGCALLSKEAAVMFPVLLTGWLALRGRPPSRAALHWLVLGGYVLYRGAVLNVTGDGQGLTEDLSGWLFRPWTAMAFPLAGDVGWARWPLAAVFALVAGRIVMKGPRLWPVAAGTVIALAPLILVFQLGPEFQSGRWLYWPLASWALLVGLAVGSRSRGTTALLGAYLVALVVAGLWPRTAFQEVGTTGERIVRQAVAVTREAPADAAVIATEMPIQENGWVLFGGYFDIAVDHARGRLGEPERPAVVDAAWSAHAGQGPVFPDALDIVVRWRGEREGFVDCSSAVPETGEAPCPELETVKVIDFGSEDLSLHRAEGFRWNEAGDGTTWNWTTAPAAVLRLRLEGSGDLLLHLRMMSVLENTISVRLNGVAAGVREIAGDFRWVEATYRLPREAWQDGPYQTIELEATTSEGGLYVALDHARFTPAGADRGDAAGAQPAQGAGSR